MPTFRVHFDLDGLAHTPALIAAPTPDAARRILADRHHGESLVIHKVKIERDAPARNGRVRGRVLASSSPH